MIDDDDVDSSASVGRRRSSMSRHQSRISDGDMFVLGSSADDQSPALASEQHHDPADDDGVVDDDDDGDVAASSYTTAAEPSASASICSPCRPHKRRSSVLPPLKPSPFRHRDSGQMMKTDTAADVQVFTFYKPLLIYTVSQKTAPFFAITFDYVIAKSKWVQFF